MPDLTRDPGMSARLGPTQRRVLDVLADYPEGSQLTTARGIAAHVNRRARSAGCWYDLVGELHSVLRRLHTAGLVERTTVTNGARCWAITDAGRKALEAPDGR